MGAVVAVAMLAPARTLNMGLRVVVIDMISVVSKLVLALRELLSTPPRPDKLPLPLPVLFVSAAAAAAAGFDDLIVVVVVVAAAIVVEVAL